MKEYTTIQQDLQNIEDFFVDDDNPESLSNMCNRIGISESDYLGIKNGIINPTKQQLEDIYNYSYTRGLYLNEITWQETLDEYRKSNVKVCTHGARTYIKGDIRLDVNNESNDFAEGFYIGQDISQAGMFVGQEPNSSLYFLTFDISDLSVTSFDVDVNWMLAVGLYRNKLDDYREHPRLKQIADEVDNCDYVLAPIADNKIFEVIDSFTEGEITDLQCLYALSATHLGYQYVLKTQKALDHLEIIHHLYYCALEKSLYNKESDIETNTSNNKAIIAKKKYKGQGQYINEILGDIILDESY